MLNQVHQLAACRKHSREAERLGQARNASDDACGTEQVLCRRQLQAKLLVEGVGVASAVPEQERPLSNSSNRLAPAICPTQHHAPQHPQFAPAAMPNSMAELEGGSARNFRRWMT